MTADDVGRPEAGDGSTRLAARARQNVVFELGFFVGQLGRAHVTVLYDERVEMPSDFSGVTYYSLAEADRPYKLLRELRSAGLDFSLGKIPT